MFGIVRFIINIVITIIELLLAFRFVFKLLTVNPSTPFVAWIYSITERFVAPFAKILPNAKFSGFVIDAPTLVALIVFGIAGSLLMWVVPHSHRETEA
jgi:YggT family protein